MRKKIILTDNRELQRKQFKIPESLNSALQDYAERIDATENSIINGLLEEFMKEVEFGATIYDAIKYLHELARKLIIISPSEHIGFNAEGNNLTLEKRITIEALKSDPNSKKYSFKAEQHTRITEYNSEFAAIKSESTSLMGLFNTIEELLSYFNVNASWSYQLNS